MAEIGIFVGTVYGNALLLAEEAEILLKTLGHETTVYDYPKLEDWEKYKNKYVLIITSSTGKGNLPDNIFPLYTAIQHQNNDQFRTVHYGFIALGDSSYTNFCGGGKKFDNLLQKKNAIRVGDVLYIDAKKHLNPESIAKSWITNWEKLI